MARNRISAKNAYKNQFNVLEDVDLTGVRNGVFLEHDETSGKFIAGKKIHHSTDAPTDLEGVDGDLWIVIPESGSSDDFKITVRTTGSDETFRLPFRETFNYNCEVDWGDGNQDTITAWDDTALTHTYALFGDHQISITGTMEAFSFGNVSDNSDNLITVDSWGDTNLISLQFAFYGCSNLVTIPAGDPVYGDTSNVTDFRSMCSQCSSLTAMPLIDMSGATNLQSTWSGCTSMTSFSGEIDTSNVTVFGQTWAACTGLTSFPGTLDLSSGTIFHAAWYNCSGLTSFPGTLDLSSGTNFKHTWAECTGLTTFPGNLNLNNGMDFEGSWWNCSSLTSFPGTLDLSNGTTFYQAWDGCSGLTSFPGTIDVSGTLDEESGFFSTWRDCTGLTSFPPLDMGNVTTRLEYTWSGCTSLISFPLITGISNVTLLSYTWHNCSSLEHFPDGLDISGVPGLRGAWSGCSGLVDFPSDPNHLGSGFDFSNTWENCSSLTSFPPLQLNAPLIPGSNEERLFRFTWQGCSSMVTFPDGIVLGDHSGVAYHYFTSAWRDCILLENFPAGIFDGLVFNTETWPNLTYSFTDTNLTAQSKDNVMASLKAQGENNGVFDMSGGESLSGQGLTDWDYLVNTMGWSTSDPPDGGVS